jgi:hypothetical protein
MEYYSAIKKHEIMLQESGWNWGPSGHHIKWNELDSERQVLCVFPHLWNIVKRK